MISVNLGWGMRALLAGVLSASVAGFGMSRVWADDTKPAQPAEQKTEEKKAEAAQPANVDEHAGHDHGPVKAVAQPEHVGPPAPGAQAPIVKPGADIPSPTVQLKPGEVPAIKFDTPNYDFGKVKSGTEIKHEFFFTNPGTGPLEVLRVKPSCGCTVAGQFDRIVQPGQTGKIPITLSSKNASGPISKTITVNTNVAGADAQIMLQVKGEVWQPIQVTPQAAAFGRITANDATQSLVRKLTIVNNLDTPITPGTPTSNNPKMKAELVALEPGKKFELTVTLIPPLDSGNTSGRITIPTGSADVPTLDVPAYAFVTAAVDVTPTSLMLPPTRSADLTRQFYVRSNINKAIKITELQSTNPAIKLELTDIKDSMTYRLKVDVPQAYVPPAGGDKITFKTDSKEVPMVTIPVSGSPIPGGKPFASLTGEKQTRNLSETGPATAAPAGVTTPTAVAPKPAKPAEPAKPAQPAEEAKAGAAK